MNIKSILCIFGGSQGELNAAKAALELGKSARAQICFLHVSPDPSSYSTFYDGDVIVSADIMEAVERDSQARLKKAEDYVKKLSEQYNIPLNEAELPAHHPSVTFQHLVGNLEAVITKRGRLCDLIIIGRGATSVNALYDFTVIAALFNTGRPVLLLPERKNDDDHNGYISFKTIAIAWKNSLEAARALYNSLPFLEEAEKVYALTAEGRGEAYDLSAESALMEYLHTHGVRVTGIVVAAGNRSHEEALLQRAKELNADLLVMGAYGHTRFREMLFGGVTNHMLENADIPLLLSH